MAMGQTNPYFSRVSEKGQITLPQEIRRTLGIRPKEYVEIEAVEEDGGVYIKVQRRQPLLMALRGVANTLGETLEWDEIERRAREATARRLLEEDA